jgi:L-2,4-diaminobutyrate decarboxylase
MDTFTDRNPLPDASSDDDSSHYAPDLLAWSDGGLPNLAGKLFGALNSARLSGRPQGPLPAGTSGAVLNAARALLGPAQVPHLGVGDDAALACVARLLLTHGIDLSHPAAAAHLQPAPLSVAVVADMLAGASNASLDTYDSGPSGIAAELWVVQALAGLAGLSPRAEGVFTPGGSLSNLLALLLARDAVGLRRGLNARRQGVTSWSRPAVFCSQLAHFSIHRACAALGLGEGAVVPVPTDGRRRMDPAALERAIAESQRTPVAIVATAGTTDFGSIDPLPAIAAIAARHKVWLHVDAAYGFGALFSTRLAARLDGLALADSITLDLHKLGWQPAPASVLLVADPAAFAALEREVPYLNPDDDCEAGLEGLLGRSLQTTRRADAVKVAATLLAHGRRGLGEMVDTCHELARYAESRITREPRLELVAPAELTTVVFRYTTGGVGDDVLNARLRRRLLVSGRALVGRTTVHTGGQARVCLKLTLLNPTATRADIDTLVDLVLGAGVACERGEGRAA